MKLKLFIIILFISTLLYSENYKKIKLYNLDKSKIVELQKLGIPLDDAYQHRDGSLDMFLNEQEFQQLQQSSVNYKIVIDDWEKHYQEEKKENLINFNILNYTPKYKVDGFTYGSMGGFYTLDEIWEKIDSLILEYPNLISNKDSIGASIENRPIYAVKISDNPNINEDEPEVLYTSLIHAREPASMMQMIYFMLYLLENYGTDEEVTYLIDNREMYFIPVINPDGYLYNESTHPDGGGMWRKNRRANADSTTYGVDLNRNYGYKWGYDDEGSSGNPASNTYRGSAGFSEPETETVRQYCIANNFILALNYHTYSNLLIVPWGYIDEETPDSIFYREIASDMTQYNNYAWGTAAALLYVVNGDSDDWFYGEQTEKNKIFAMTPEVGSSSDGFWPLVRRIIPLADENVFPNLYLAWVAGGFVNTKEIFFDEKYYSAGDSGYATISIRNKGLENITNVQITLSSSDNLEILAGNTITIGNINSRAIDTLANAIKFNIKEDAIAGDSVSFEIKYFAGNALMATNNYSFIVGYPETYFIDSLSTLENWDYESNVSKNWELTNTEFYSTPSAVTDSRVGNYQSNAIVTLTNKERIDLSSINKPFLKFKTKYDIEAGWDYGEVSISSDSVTWQPIGGGSSKLGAGHFQPTNKPVYDGLQKEWITETININSYGGKEVYIRFQLKSDSYIVKDGWYVDDIEIFEYTNEVVSVNKSTELPTKFSLFQNYPNPFNPSTEIVFSIPVSSNTTLTIYNILGQKVATLINEELSAGSYKYQFNASTFRQGNASSATASNLASGIYFYKLQTDDYLQVKKMMLIK